MSIKIKVEASGLEFDPEKETVGLECPDCQTAFTVTFGQIQRQETVKCGKCQANLKLEDKEGSPAKAVADINKGFDELRRALEELGG